MTSTPTNISEKLPEFCEYCGAGLYTFRRFGEGTCKRCDPKRSAVETTGVKSPLDWMECPVSKKPCNCRGICKLIAEEP